MRTGTTKFILNTLTGVAAGLLVAVAPASANEPAPIAFTCASGETLTVNLLSEGSSAQVQLGDQAVVKVLARPSREGSRFSDARHELRIVGTEASWRVGSRTPVKCAASDTARLAELKR